MRLSVFGCIAEPSGQVNTRSKATPSVGQPEPMTSRCSAAGSGADGEPRPWPGAARSSTSVAAVSRSDRQPLRVVRVGHDLPDDRHRPCVEVDVAPPDAGQSPTQAPVSANRSTRPAGTLGSPAQKARNRPTCSEVQNGRGPLAGPATSTSAAGVRAAEEGLDTAAQAIADLACADVLHVRDCRRLRRGMITVPSSRRRVVSASGGATLDADERWPGVTLEAHFPISAWRRHDHYWVSTLEGRRRERHCRMPPCFYTWPWTAERFAGMTAGTCALVSATTTGDARNSSVDDR
jgi:hypothetical protein